MSTTKLFYIVKVFGLIKRGMRVKHKCNHFKCNQGFSNKDACHKMYATLG
jgi:ribosomal protein L20A (L18A)